MTRAIRASASSALIVHSENGFDSRKLNDGRMGASSIWDAPALRVQLWPAQNCSLPNRRHDPLPNYRDAEVLRSATGSKSINQPPSMGKAARVATSGLLTSTLGYPARGPASWRRRSESSIIIDSAVVGFTDTLHDSCAVQYSRPWLRSKNRNRNSRTVVTPVYVAASEGRPVRSRERRP